MTTEKKNIAACEDRRNPLTQNTQRDITGKILKIPIAAWCINNNRNILCKGSRMEHCD